MSWRMVLFKSLRAIVFVLESCFRCRSGQPPQCRVELCVGCVLPPHAAACVVHVCVGFKLLKGKRPAWPALEMQWGDLASDASAAGGGWGPKQPARAQG